ncbi:MAG TPA: transcription elongation factor GreA [Dehalococcoidia bacterium]|nr:transcription elongation factor GreA [Dehalococcoidia bacterium]
MSEEQVLITKQGLKKLEAELLELRTTKRAEVAEQIREAQELGMAQVDGQYEDAKNQQAFLEGRIQEIEKMLESAELIDEKAAKGSKEIRVGSTVSLKTKGGKSQTYQLVGPAEADPTQGRISHKSPVGEALIGRKRGDKVKVAAPAGNVEMTVVSVK